MPAEAALLLRYSFDEASTGTTAALDSGTGTAANGSFVNSATRTGATFPGSVGALNTDFADAAGTWLSGGDANKLDSLDAMTITAWVNFREAPATNDRLISKLLANSSTTFTGFDLRMNGSGQMGFAQSNNSGLTTAFSSSAISTAQGWQFIAVTYDGTGSVRFYTGTETAAATQLGTTVAQAFVDVGDSTADFRVGGTAATSSDRSPRAWFDDVRVYDTALDSAGVGAIEAVRQANVPEPAGVALLAAAAGLLASRRRRKTHV